MMLKRFLHCSVRSLLSGSKAHLGIHRPLSSTTIMDVRNTLSKRGKVTVDFSSFMMTNGGEIVSDIYHEIDNPQGYINLGVAENYTIEDLVCPKINESINLCSKSQYYYTYAGKEGFRTALAKFMTKHMANGNQLDPNNVLVTSGVGAAIELIGQMFSDPGDCWLMLTPYYSAIDADLGLRCGVRVHRIHRSCHATDDVEAFSFNDDLLEKGYQEAIKKGESVKGIILINPCNPTGKLYTAEDLKTAAKFAERHEIHIVFDEIYALSVHEEGAKFCSALSVTDLPKTERTHVLWGFSKDFGLSGLRCGVLYTWNQLLYTGIERLAYFGGVPSTVQDALQRMISDDEWINSTFLPTSLRRMKMSHDRMRQGLIQLGVDCAPSQSTFFLYADFSKFLKEKTQEEELKLFEEIKSAKVYMLPGSALGSVDYGWFRITCTNREENMDEGLSRLAGVLKNRR